MNLVKIEDGLPQIDEWYLVKCWDWCESGYAVAQWDGNSWTDNSGRVDFNDYVTHYFDTPIEEM